MSDPGPTPPPSSSGGPGEERWRQLALGSAALLVVGAFLPWVRLSVFLHTVTQSGIGDGNGWLFVLLGAACAALAFTTHPEPRQKPVVFYALGGIGLLLTISTWTSLADAPAAAGGLVRVRAGIGLYLVLLGSVGAVAAGLVLQRSTT